MAPSSQKWTYTYAYYFVNWCFIWGVGADWASYITSTDTAEPDAHNGVVWAIDLGNNGLDDL